MSSGIGRTVLAALAEGTAAAVDSFDQGGEAALEILYAATVSGKSIFVTGVGKSGYVAARIAAVLRTAGIPATHLNPLDALHGEIGPASSGDVQIALSASGKTAELLEVTCHLAARGVAVLALTVSENSPLQAIADLTLIMRVPREPLAVMSAVSSAVLSAMCEALCAELIVALGISAADILKNHPSGALPERLRDRPEISTASPLANQRARNEQET